MPENTHPTVDPHSVHRQPPVSSNARPPPQRSSSNTLTVLMGNRSGPQGSTPIPPSLQAKMAAMANRGQPSSPPSSAALDNAAAAFVRVSLSDSPGPAGTPRAHSYPNTARGRGGSLAGKRVKPNFKLSDINGSNGVPSVGGGAAGAGLGAGRPNLAGPAVPRRPPSNIGSPFSNFGKIVDPSGVLNFSGKAVLHASGVDFSNGSSFAINMEQLQLDEELGKGNYGTVKKVLHRPTNVAMAMKEIRLELDETKLNGIIMELDILHRAVHPEIVEFYGAFFIESCVYYCMEYMDAGSLDKLTSAAGSGDGPGVPEDVLARIANCMVRGLKFLKDDLQIIHRDVKPTNVLVNRRGQVKLCDFGVSGQLEKSLAKTNIGCQSYMAPERIKGESQNNLVTYTVSSDVWSLGLSMIEIGMGRYPYPPETYSNVFAQLTAIVHGDPPELPGKLDPLLEAAAAEGEAGDKRKVTRNTYSDTARDWVARCLAKEPERRATYAELLEHPFLSDEVTKEVDMEGWVSSALAHRELVKNNNSGEEEPKTSLSV